MNFNLPDNLTATEFKYAGANYFKLEAKEKETEHDRDYFLYFLPLTNGMYEREVDVINQIIMQIFLAVQKSEDTEEGAE